MFVHTKNKIIFLTNLHLYNWNERLWRQSVCRRPLTINRQHYSKLMLSMCRCNSWRIWELPVDLMLWSTIPATIFTFLIIWLLIPNTHKICDDRIAPYRITVSNTNIWDPIINLSEIEKDGKYFGGTFSKSTECGVTYEPIKCRIEWFAAFNATQVPKTLLVRLSLRIIVKLFVQKNGKGDCLNFLFTNFLTYWNTIWGNVYILFAYGFFDRRSTSNSWG